MNRMVGDFRALFEDAFGKKTAPSYARCKAAISQQAPTFYELLDLHRRLVENGPDGQGGGHRKSGFSRSRTSNPRR